MCIFRPLMCTHASTCCCPRRCEVRLSLYVGGMLRRVQCIQISLFVLPPIRYLKATLGYLMYVPGACRDELVLASRGYVPLRPLQWFPAARVALRKLMPTWPVRLHVTAQLSSTPKVPRLGKPGLASRPVWSGQAWVDLSPSIWSLSWASYSPSIVEQTVVCPLLPHGRLGSRRGCCLRPCLI